MTDRLTPERKKALELIAKLLALAEDRSAYDAEARTAREKAYQLMTEYNISSADAATSEPYEIRETKSYFTEDVWWDRIVKFSLAELNNCWPLLRSGVKDQVKCVYRIVGRPRDLDAYDYMLGIVLRQRSKAWNDYQRDGGPDTKGKWLYGYARGLEAKVDRMLAELDTRLRGHGRNDLVPSGLQQQIKARFEDLYGPVGHGLEQGGRGRSADGFAAGSNVNLYRGEVGAPVRQLGRVQRLTDQRRY
jgi:hypothetical protein